MGKVGLARGKVRLVKYDSSWKMIFKAEARTLSRTLAVGEYNIKHVGSTAIPGIAAKPIIDIAILVDDLDIAESWQAPLKELGYWYKGKQADMPDRRFFAKGPESCRTVYLHLVNKQEFNKLIKFRDYLRKDEELAKQYSELKLKLAAANSDNRANYSKLKNDFIQSVLLHP